MTIKLPGSKIRDLRRSIRQVLAYPSPTPRKIHSIIMRIRSATSSVFLTDLYTQALMRYKNRTVKYESHWDKPLKLPTECVQELAWWENLQKWNGRFLMGPLSGGNNLRRRQRSRMGRGVWLPSRSGSLASPRPRAFNQLARTQSYSSHSMGLPRRQERVDSDSQ